MWLHRLFALLAIPTLTHAAGILHYEIGSSDTRYALAGWAARAENPSTVFTNPAGLTRFCQPAVEVGVQGIGQHVFFNSDTRTTVFGRDGRAHAWSPTGSLFFVQPLNDRIVLGFGTFKFLDSDLDFNSDWVGRYYFTRHALQGVSLVPVACYKWSESISVGVGAHVVYGRFAHRSAVNNVLDGLPDGTLRLRDTNWAAGFIGGILYQPNECTRIGLQYLSSVEFHFKPRAQIGGVGPSLAGLLSVATPISMRAEIPQQVMVSGIHDLDGFLSVMINVGWQQWSKFKKPSFGPTVATFFPKYRDTWHLALGMRYYIASCWSVSGGIAYDSSPITNAHRPLDFPIGKQLRLATGLGYTISEHLSADLSYAFNWMGELPIEGNQGGLAGTIGGAYEDASFQAVCLNLTWAF